MYRNGGKKPAFNVFFIIRMVKVRLMCNLVLNYVLKGNWINIKANHSSLFGPH